MKKLFNSIILMCIAALIVACGKENLQQEENGDKIQISLLFSIGNSPLSIGEPMAGTKGTADGLFDAIYEGIVSGEIIASYELTFKNINTGTSTTISGNWTDNKTISLEKGTYTIYGISAATGKGIYQTCSLSYQDEVTITPQTRSITIKAQYDCSLLILNDDSVDRILYYASQNDSTSFSQYHNLTYAFVKSAEDFTQGNKAFLKVYFKNGKSGIVDLGQINIQKGKYYLLENLNNYADAGLVLVIDKMENGNVINEAEMIVFSQKNRVLTSKTFDVYAWKTVGTNVNQLFNHVPVEHFSTDTQGTYVYNNASAKPSDTWGADWATDTQGWLYESIRYWDNSATGYDFYAIAPYEEKPSPVITVTNDDYNIKIGDADHRYNISTEKNLAINPTITNERKYVGFNKDYMLADKSTAKGELVSLNFHHILTKLNVMITLSDSYLGSQPFIFKKLHICGLANNGYFVNNTSDMTVNQWNTTSGSTYNWEIDNDYVLKNAPDNVADKTEYSGYYLLQTLVFPQEITCAATGAQASAPNSKYLMIEYTIGGELFRVYYDLANIFNNQITGGNTFVLKQGSEYTINIIVGPSVVVFETTVSDWPNDIVLE